MEACNEYVLCTCWIYCKIREIFCKIHLEKKYTRKEYLKIVIIIVIIVVPLVVAYGAAGYFDSEDSKFWSEWDCDHLIGYTTSSEFNQLSDEEKIQYELELTPCIDAP